VKYLIATPSQLSHALRNRRKIQGLSQANAGRLVGLLPKTISAMENHPGSVTIDSLLKLLSALELELVLAPKESLDSTDTRAPYSGKEW
jgi:HTH-type transcriptional regulator/antitoxin HipB